MPSCHKTPRSNITEPISDVDLRNNTANDVAVWFIRQMFINGLSKEKMLGVLTLLETAKGLLL